MASQPTLNHQLVADAVHGQEVPGIVAVVAELLAQLHDHLVERARGAIVIVAPHVVKQAVARQDLTGMRGEELEEL